MPDTASGARLSMMQLILVPAIVTLALTVLRLVGELQHWSPRLFNPEPGGGGALVGISWLPFILGPYFALKLAASGEGSSGAGKSIGFAFLGLVIMICGGFVGFAPQVAFPGHQIVGLLILVGGALLQYSSWPALFKTLLAYGYAARIPVAIVMFFAIQGSWGTHYDAAPPNYNGPTDLVAKWGFIGLIPQLVIWPAFTIVAGFITGTIVTAIVRRGKPAVQTAA